MDKVKVLRRIRETGLVPVLRADSIAEALAIIAAIAAGGVDIVEVTMTIPGALRVIQTLVREYPGILIGAGTVLDPDTARVCMLEGAQFIVSPVTNIKVTEMCQRYSCAVLLGALTPTEVVQAWQAGADVVKIFPASAMGGPTYLRTLRGPLPQVELLPTGGVTVEAAQDYLAAGAFALGVGSDLANPKAIHDGKPERISQAVANYLRAISEFRAAGAIIRAD